MGILNDGKVRLNYVVCMNTFLSGLERFGSKQTSVRCGIHAYVEWYVAKEMLKSLFMVEKCIMVLRW